MMKSSVFVILFLVVVFDVIPQWTSSSRLIRVLRSPDTTPESHISNFLHQHRADSRADKPELKPDNSTDPQHRRPSKPKTTTTEPPISQTELLVNLIHNTIVTVREQFPALIGAISSPSNPPTPPKPPKKVHHAVHQTHAHVMQERSTNGTSEEEEVTESGETSAGSREEGDDVLDEEDGEGEDEGAEEFPMNNNPAALIPPALIRTIVEASGSSAARGSAGASAGSAASTIAGASSSSSSGTGRSARQVEEESQGSGSGEFLYSIISNKFRALSSLFLSPIFAASRFFQRSFGALSSGSSGVDSGLDPRHRHAGEHSHHHSDDDHHHHHGSDHHHSDHHHEHRSGDHDHHSHHHSGDHGHHSGDHNHDHQHNSTPVDDSANLILGNDEMQDNGRKFYYRDAPYNATNMNSSFDLESNDTMENEISSEDSANLDEPLRIVLINSGQDVNDGRDNIQRRIIVRRKREAKALFSEGFGIYILEIFGSIAGLTWGAIHQISHIFQGRSDEPDEFY